MKRWHAWIGDWIRVAEAVVSMLTFCYWRPCWALRWYTLVQ